MFKQGFFGLGQHACFCTRLTSEEGHAIVPKLQPSLTKDSVLMLCLIDYLQLQALHKDTLLSRGMLPQTKYFGHLLRKEIFN